MGDFDVEIAPLDCLLKSNSRGVWLDNKWWISGTSSIYKGQILLVRQIQGPSIFFTLSKVTVGYLMKCKR